ncbi:MAG: DNA alkylation repair protein [Saprospiraceae bacterium]|nr:DNA alkylation repair protein [Saprospiraceae bacterium]
MTNILDFETALRQVFEAQADLENAFYMKRYMRDKFNFYGIKSPDRKNSIKGIIKEKGLPDPTALQEFCRLCFQQDEREWQYAVGDLMEPLARKLNPSWLPLLEELIVTKSWWDTVDFLSPKLCGGLFLSYPELLHPTALRWIESDNFWLQRAAIIAQLTFKQKTDSELLFDCIRRRRDSKEFFVNKAAGWALRQYARVAPDIVKAFVNDTDLSALTYREAVRHLSLP